jgi:hypothetical protein
VETTKALLRELAARAAEAGSGFGVVIAPTIWQVHEDQWVRLIERYELDPAELDRRAPQDDLLGFCRDAGLHCLDLLPPLAAHAANGEELYDLREQHWNPGGNRRVAESIHRWLASEAGVRRPSSRRITTRISASGAPGQRVELLQQRGGPFPRAAVLGLPAREQQRPGFRVPPAAHQALAQSALGRGDGEVPRG